MFYECTIPNIGGMQIQAAYKGHAFGIVDELVIGQCLIAGSTGGGNIEVDDLNTAESVPGRLIFDRGRKVDAANATNIGITSG